MRKCLEAVYVAKNEVVNGCSGANMGASWRTYLWAAVLSGYLIHLWFCVGKPMTGLGENVKLLRILILFVLPFNF